MKLRNCGLMLIVSITICTACGSDTTQPADEMAAPNTPAIQNVNGNLPDSSNTINLNNTQPIDSSRLKDSLQK